MTLQRRTATPRKETLDLESVVVVVVMVARQRAPFPQVQQVLHRPPS
jgi:hypothetical protein